MPTVRIVYLGGVCPAGTGSPSISSSYVKKDGVSHWMTPCWAPDRGAARHVAGFLLDEESSASCQEGLVSGKQARLHRLTSYKMTLRAMNDLTALCNLMAARRVGSSAVERGSDVARLPVIVQIDRCRARQIGVSPH